MEKQIIVIRDILLAMVCLSLVACAGRRVGESVPPKPDYSDSAQWYITTRSADVDIFYVTSTETGDYLSDGHPCHYADTYSDSLRLPILGEMVGVDSLLSGTLNFYSPYYRQCSLQSFVNDSLAQARLSLPMSDVRRAFKHYLEHFNAERPFVLAGYSQGAIIVLDLLRRMPASVYSRLVAAYVIGASVPQSDVVAGGNILPARAADDTGVTVCYNSVRSAQCALWPRSALCINPVNWRTDSTAALLITEPSPLLPTTEQKRDTITVRLDTVSNLLLLDGFTATDYVLPLIGKQGNYHSREIWLYRDLLRQNIALRTSRFHKYHAYKLRK